VELQTYGLGEVAKPQAKQKPTTNQQPTNTNTKQQNQQLTKSKPTDI
jgi:hypothetical protein